MPCRDFYDDHPERYYEDVTLPALKKQISFAESALCLTLNTLEKVLEGVRHDFDDKIKTNPLDIMDLQEAGITRKDLESWWKKHKKLDKEHRAATEASKRSTALAKLTDEEKKILGVK